MRNKGLLRTLSALCLTLVLASGFTVPAFAQGAAPPPAEDTTNDSNVVVEEPEKAPALTPEGNAALVDDFGGNKQLITVTTKAGNYFYILIDRVNEDKKTAVHFLNQVDEADLMALMEDGNAKEEAVLRTHIVNYAKTREVYVAYRKAGYSKKFREEHEEEILLHQAAKNAFNEMGVKKLPKVKELQTEYAKLLEEKKKTYAEYRRSREEMRELLTAKANVDRVLKMEVEQDVEKEKDHGQR